MNYKIYQMQRSNKLTYHFMGWEFAKRYNFTLDDYNLVYEGQKITYKNGIECKDPMMCLEMLFTKFNIRRPSDFTGHSLSVSDVVELITDDKSKFYYCDSFGWEDITEEVLMQEVTI